MSGITTHVLDLARGRPADGVEVALDRHDEEAGWRELARETTDADGRATGLVPVGTRVEPGTYRLRFAAGAYFERRGITSFHPTVAIAFAVRDPAEHHHVPLLLAPHGYTTYRGS